MFTIILIVLIVIAIVGALRAMTKSERATVIKGATNVLSFGTVYTAKVAKGAVKNAYVAGNIVGTHVSLEGQDSLNAVSDFNKDLQSKGGVVRVAINTANEHAVSLGLQEYADEMSKVLKEAKVKLEEARSNRDA